MFLNPVSRSLSLVILLLFTTSFFGQEESEQAGEITEKEVALAEIEQAPYPKACRPVKDDPKAVKQCLSDFIANFVGRNFKLKKFENLEPKRYRISIQFKIDNKGRVAEVRARTDNAIVQLENEAIRVIKKLPRMQPGVVDGKTVSVLYGLPINIVVPENEKNKK